MPHAKPCATERFRICRRQRTCIACVPDVAGKGKTSPLARTACQTSLETSCPADRQFSPHLERRCTGDLCCPVEAGGCELDLSPGRITCASRAVGRRTGRRLRRSARDLCVAPWPTPRSRAPGAAGDPFWCRDSRARNARSERAGPTFERTPRARHCHEANPCSMGWPGTILRFT